MRYAASSHAESPPPITANSSSLNCGVAPSQIAQALIPLLQNLSSFITPNLLALAPVAIIIELDLMIMELNYSIPVHYFNRAAASLSSSR